MLSFLTTTRRNCPHLYVESEPMYADDDDNEALLTMEIVKEEMEEEEDHPH